MTTVNEMVEWLRKEATRNAQIASGDLTSRRRAKYKHKAKMLLKAATMLESEPTSGDRDSNFKAFMAGLGPSRWE